MAKLIDAMRIDFDEVDISGCTDVDDIIAAVEDLIDAQPAVDAVEVVRCKECKRYVLEYGKYWCKKYAGTFAPDDFCSHGERRCNDGKA